MNTTVMPSDLVNSIITAEVLERISAPTAAASGLPNACYTSEAWFALERERVFARTWMLAGFCHDVPKPGDACPVDVAGVPIVLLRDDAGAIRVYHNVCRHRGAVLVPAACSGRKVLTCPYHSWVYGLDGRLRTVPHYHGPGRHLEVKPADGMPNLVPVRHAVWHDLIFVDLGGKAPDFADHWAPFATRMADYDFSKLRYARTLTFDIKGNWKLIFENFYDNYHIPSIHKRLDDFSPFELRAASAGEGDWLLGSVPFPEPEAGRGMGMPYYPGLNEKAQRTEWFFHLFPTICLVGYPDQLAVYHIHAVSPERTIEDIHVYFVGDGATDPAHEAARQSVYDTWNELNAEDFGIVENIQMARRSPAFDGGRLSPFWDTATQYFSKLTIDAMTKA